MDPRLSPVMVAIFVVPVILLGICAMFVDVSQSRRDRGERVVTTWGDLRITPNFLIVGYRRNARRIPLTGLKVAVTETGSTAGGDDAHLVHVTITGIDGETPLRRTQPYSYGSITAARMFEILLNRSTPPAPAAPVAESPALHWAA